MRGKETLPPITVGEQTKVRLPLAMLLALLGFVAAGAVVISTDRASVADHTTQLADQAARLRKLEDAQGDIRVMKNDVEWIRKTLEQRRD
ncbi:MAG TPA: hypothetical protein VLH79_06775 [Chthonomonadales bacterium]|nr:hypothetical protein [Chthonomonadales bacterium]